MINAPYRERATALLQACHVSAVVQLIMVVTAFIVFPILFHAVVRESQAERDSMRLQLVRDRVALISKGLAPDLESATPADADRLAARLDRYAAEDYNLKLLFRPPASAAPAGVFFIAGTPQASADQVRVANEALQAQGVFDRLIESCDNPLASGDTVLDGGGTVTTLTSVPSPYGCWGIVTTATAVPRASFWSNPALKIIALVYAGIVALTLASAASLLFNLRRARDEAASARARVEQSSSLLDLEVLLSDAQPAAPDPAPAAQTRLQPNLGAVQEAAPENANGPHDAFAAALLDTARSSVNLSEIVRAHIVAERKLLEQGVERLTADIADDVFIVGRADFVATILDELIGNALGTEGTAHVVVSLQQDDLRRRAVITVVYDTAVPWPSEVFGRLSLIKQFVTALGGLSASEHREDGGVTVRVALPA